MQIANFAPPPAIVSLPVTVADCADTTTETAVITVTVPPNAWGNGKTIAINGYFSTQNSSGGSINLTIKAKVNSSSVTLANAVSISDSGVTGKSLRGITLKRIGNDVILLPGSSTGSDFMPNTTVLTSAAGFATNNFSTNIYTSVDFTAAITITLTVQWSGAPGDGSAFFNCLFADALKY